mmetsp:Transcript_29498/g.88188  ORF Transcript_29498/g.88188 Transcript_29498/m.88188 type:complete len:80 (-) Transcript_29498:85-324(-)
MSAPQQLHHTPRVTQRARARAEGRARLRYGAARYLALLPSSLLLSWLSYNTVAYIGRPAQRARAQMSRAPAGCEVSPVS